jgi:hypothetical protein
MTWIQENDTDPNGSGSATLGKIYGRKEKIKAKKDALNIKMGKQVK